MFDLHTICSKTNHFQQSVYSGFHLWVSQLMLIEQQCLGEAGRRAGAKQAWWCHCGLVCPTFSSFLLLPYPPHLHLGVLQRVPSLNLSVLPSCSLCVKPGGIALFTPALDSQYLGWCLKTGDWLTGCGRGGQLGDPSTVVSVNIATCCWGRWKLYLLEQLEVLLYVFLNSRILSLQNRKVHLF